MIENHDAEAKRAVFVDMVRTALIVSTQSKSSSAAALLNVVHNIGALTQVSMRIPDDLQRPKLPATT